MRIGGVELKTAHIFFNSAVDAAELWFSRFATFAPSGKTHGIYGIGSLYQEHNHWHLGLLISDHGTH
jgi:hypothetical protein